MTQALARKEESTNVVQFEGRNTLAKLNMRELKEVAAVFIESGSFNDVKQAAQAMVKIMAGQELGFSPIVSMTNIHFFNGKVSIGSNLMASLVKDSGKYEYKITEHTAEVCSIQFFQRIKDELKSLGVPVRYTWADAVKAGLTGKDVWKKYPADMLFAACIRQGTRRYCADVLRGMTPETDNGVEVDTIDRTAMDAVPELQSAGATETTTIDGEIVDTETGEVIDIEPETEQSSQRSQPSGQSTASEPEGNAQQPHGSITKAVDLATDAELLAEVNELFKIKCGDGETIDEEEALKVLKGRDLTQLNAAGLEKLKGELAAM